MTTRQRLIALLRGRGATWDSEQLAGDLGVSGQWVRHLLRELGAVRVWYLPDRSAERLLDRAP